MREAPAGSRKLQSPIGSLSCFISFEILIFIERVGRKPQIEKKNFVEKMTGYIMAILFIEL